MCRPNYEYLSAGCRSTFVRCTQISNENFLIFFSAGVTHSMGSTHNWVNRVGLVTPGASSKRRKPSPWVVVTYDSEFQTVLSSERLSSERPSPPLRTSTSWRCWHPFRRQRSRLHRACPRPRSPGCPGGSGGPGDRASRGATPAPSTSASPGLSPVRVHPPCRHRLPPKSQD